MHKKEVSMASERFEKVLRILDTSLDVAGTVVEVSHSLAIAIRGSIIITLDGMVGSAAFQHLN